MSDSAHAGGGMTTIRSVARASRILVHLGEQPEGRTAKEVAVALESAACRRPTTCSGRSSPRGSWRRTRAGAIASARRSGTIADAFVRQFSPPEYLIGPLHRLADETRRDRLRR